jgi:thiol-disulfide isomerase/thioredoxin
MKFIAALLTLFLAIVPAGFADDEHPRPFDENFDAMSVVDEALAQARGEDKRVLLILGANWCHDSRGLAHHLEDPEIAALLAQNYVQRFIDVGWRDQNHAVMNRFGVAAIYGTPTVFIIEPSTETLLNHAERSAWTSAASASTEAVHSYFERWSHAYPALGGVAESSLIYQSMMIEIDLFEEDESRRLAAAYSDIGRWRSLNADARPDNYRALSREVDRWRGGMPGHVADLRSQARAMVVDALLQIAGDGSITVETVAILDARDPDLSLDFERHESDVW